MSVTHAASANPNTVFDPARVIEVDPGVCYAGAWANVSLTHWVSRGTVSAVECVGRVGAELRAQYPMGTSAVHLIREGAGLPTSEVREGLVKLMNEKVERRGCVGIVVGGAGFWASAIRGLITGLRSASTREYPLKLAGSIDELVSWLPEPHFKRTTVALDRAELARALQAASQWLPE
jgi:hypothetical protein